MNAPTITSPPDRSARNIVPLDLTAFRAGMRTGVEAGHDDAIAHIEPLIRGLWSDLRTYRGLRATSHRELADFRVYTRLADANSAVLRDLFAIRRDLKGGTR